MSHQHSQCNPHNASRGCASRFTRVLRVVVVLLRKNLQHECLQGNIPWLHPSRGPAIPALRTGQIRENPSGQSATRAVFSPAECRAVLCTRATLGSVRMPLMHEAQK